ncbi:MAG: phosphate acetyltransferase [Omnitrophica bacterium]|nr:phosphate acetyltransferase [Candidatus Omnitrophota bacterium]
MAGRIEKLKEIAKKNPKKIVFPEGSEARVLEAAKIIASLGIAEVILIGEEKKIQKKISENPIKLEDICVIDPKKHPGLEELTETFYNLRKHKGITRDEAKKKIAEDPVYFAALLVRSGAADGFVAGASHTTRNVARAALHCLGLDSEIGVMSSSFAIEMDTPDYGDQDGLFVFGDCGIVPNPSPMRLAGIAISSSRLYEELFKRKARTALLSYSTKGSGRGESVEKVREALEIIKKKAPGLVVDGELQLDAAITPEVAKIKSPGSPIGGKANVLIFPNLDAGNIAYKLVQRLGNARVVGPILEGLTKPASDLSRGCGVQEIVDAACVVAIRAGKC